MLRRRKFTLMWCMMKTTCPIRIQGYWFFLFVLFHIRMCHYSRVVSHSRYFALFSFLPCISQNSFRSFLFNRFDITYEAMHRFVYHLHPHTLTAVIRAIGGTSVLKSSYSTHVGVIVVAIVMLLLFLLFDPNLICYISSYLTFVSL